MARKISCHARYSRLFIGWAASLQYCYFAVFGPLPSASQMYEDYGDDDEGQGTVT